MGKADAILDAAVALFAQRGFSQATVSEIASSAGVANGTVIYHYKSKENLLYVISWFALSTLLKRTRMEIAGASSGLEGVDFYIRAFFHYLDDHTNKFHVYLQNPAAGITDADPHLLGNLEALRTRYREMLVEILCEGLRDGSVPGFEVGTPEEAAFGIQSMLFGSAWLALCQNHERKKLLPQSLATAYLRLTRKP